MQSTIIPAGESPCLKCNTYNPPTIAACAMCGARLPWADALQTQMAQNRAQQVQQEAFIKAQNRQATRNQADQTIEHVAGWILPVVGVCVAILVVGSILLMGLRGGMVIVPVGLLARLFFRYMWND